MTCVPCRRCEPSHADPPPTRCQCVNLHRRPRAVFDRRGAARDDGNHLLVWLLPPKPSILLSLLRIQRPSGDDAPEPPASIPYGILRGQLDPSGQVGGILRRRYGSSRGTDTDRLQKSAAMGRRRLEQRLRPSDQSAPKLRRKGSKISRWLRLPAFGEGAALPFQGLFGRGVRGRVDATVAWRLEADAVESGRGGSTRANGRMGEWVPRGHRKFAGGLPSGGGPRRNRPQSPSGLFSSRATLGSATDRRHSQTTRCCYSRQHHHHYYQRRRHAALHSSRRLASRVRSALGSPAAFFTGGYCTSYDQDWQAHPIWERGCEPASINVI